MLALLLRLARHDPPRCVRVLEKLEALEEPAQALEDDELRDLLGKIAAGELLASLGAGDRELFRRGLAFEAPLSVGVAPLLVAVDDVCEGDGERLIALGMREEWPDVVRGPAFTPNPLVRAYAARAGLGIRLSAAQPASGRPEWPVLQDRFELPPGFP